MKIKEALIQKTRPGSGSEWDIAFSKDRDQKFIYLADGSDEKVFILLRDTLEVVSSFWRRRAVAGHVFRRAQHCDRLERQHLHD